MSNNTVVIMKDKVGKVKIQKSLLLLVLPSLFLLRFMFIPLFSILKLSFLNAEGSLSLDSYLRLFSDGVYFKVILLTLRVSFIVMLLCLFLGFPVAYAMTKCSKRVTALIMILVMIPFWTSLLVRTYAWMMLLRSDGVINNLLLKMGVISHPLQLMNNTLGVYIGMTHVLLPYMILSLYPVLASIDENYVKAAMNLGANKWQSFFKVYFPLSMQGVSAGSILVFVMAIGYFITPSLLGGSNTIMVSQLIQVQVSKLLNWNFSSAVSMVLLLISLLILYVSKKIMKIEKLW
jgi:putative spermidine/putrescine transport system permease protein/spermidine/putrescine transport system permease protein